jgi:hypothetical protein
MPMTTGSFEFELKTFSTTKEQRSTWQIVRGWEKGMARSTDDAFEGDRSLASVERANSTNRNDESIECQGKCYAIVMFRIELRLCRVCATLKIAVNHEKTGKCSNAEPSSLPDVEKNV